jgi:hypothetical protein
MLMELKLKTVNNIDREIIVLVYASDLKNLWYKLIAEAICRYYNQINGKKGSTRR